MTRECSYTGSSGLARLCTESHVRGRNVKNERRLSLLEAVSLNMSLMVGIGPFITLPALVGTLRGPQSMIGWVLAAWWPWQTAWSGASWPRRSRARAARIISTTRRTGIHAVGRILKFLFVWQFFFSGPLEIATGAIGLAKYAGYFFPLLDVPAWNWGSIVPGKDIPVVWGQVAAMGVMGLVTVLAYRRISVAGRLMVVLWAGMLLTVLWVIVAAASRFDARLAFDFPVGAFRSIPRMVMGLGLALAIAMYDFFGYYQVCYLGDEVTDAARTIPRSIIISVLAVGLMYLGMNVAILGVIPWRDMIVSQHIASDLMYDRLRALGSRSRHDLDHLDGACLGICGHAGLQPDSVCLGQGGSFLWGLRQAASHGAVPAPVAGVDRRPWRRSRVWPS